VDEQGGKKSRNNRVSYAAENMTKKTAESPEMIKYNEIQMQ